MSQHDSLLLTSVSRSQVVQLQADERGGTFFMSAYYSLLHRLNAILAHDTFASADCPDWWSFHSAVYS